MDNITQALDAVQYKLPKIKLRLGEQMKNRTSFKIGGPVRAMFFPERIDQLTKLYDLLRECNVMPLVMGNGTNLLASDAPLEIVAINTIALNNCELTGEEEITAGAGALLSKIAIFASECGLSGFEFAHGIPGTLGGAVSMNAGAYGSSMENAIKSTFAHDRETGTFTVSGQEHGFSHRHSRFSESCETILGSVIKLQKNNTETIRAKMDELYTRRRESQPLDMPSAGSVFKRPEVGFTGSLIEEAGLKGYILGGAQVSEMHAGFIVNTGGATFSDVMGIIDHVKETVFKQFGVELELEIKIIR